MDDGSLERSRMAGCWRDMRLGKMRIITGGRAWRVNLGRVGRGDGMPFGELQGNNEQGKTRRGDENKMKIMGTTNGNERLSKEETTTTKG